LTSQGSDLRGGQTFASWVCLRSFAHVSSGARVAVRSTGWGLERRDLSLYPRNVATTSNGPLAAAVLASPRAAARLSSLSLPPDQEQEQVGG